MLFTIFQKVYRKLFGKIFANVSPTKIPGPALHYRPGPGLSEPSPGPSTGQWPKINLMTLNINFQFSLTLIFGTCEGGNT